MGNGYNSWNEIPFDASASAEEKAAEFEAQWNENGGNDPQVDNNPFSKENFNSEPDRRGK
ncbi:hypothetical protein SEA_STELLA_59 [Streptomyces phage Stella]|nr:hypothetical protein SEA_STELLA_59 [Streptomyces phage Stella]